MILRSRPLWYGSVKSHADETRSPFYAGLAERSLEQRAVQHFSDMFSKQRRASQAQRPEQRKEQRARMGGCCSDNVGGDSFFHLIDRTRRIAVARPHARLSLHVTPSQRVTHEMYGRGVCPPCPSFARCGFPTMQCCGAQRASFLSHLRYEKNRSVGQVPVAESLQ